MRGIGEVVAEVRNFEPGSDGWATFQSLVKDLAVMGMPPEAFDAVFGVFERFPDESDCGGVFWPVLHGLEALPGYEVGLVRSLGRGPSEMNVLLAGRLLNAGVAEAGGVALLPRLREVAADEAAPPRAREAAAGFVSLHAPHA